MNTKENSAIDRNEAYRVALSLNELEIIKIGLQSLGVQESSIIQSASGNYILNELIKKIDLTVYKAENNLATPAYKKTGKKKSMAQQLKEDAEDFDEEAFMKSLESGSKK